ncbi:MAG: hypothetical protein A4E58_01508 [Syntrophorhabdus sp. PtaB.Bin006]|nr:MAG: hypothetical protein A4E58_01508 [Syntrophorhabdus sp. PtaB.Bin006]
MSDTISSYKTRLDASMIETLSQPRGVTEFRIIFCASSMDTVTFLFLITNNYAKNWLSD